MPQKVIEQFEKQYPGKGKEMYYKTAKAQGSDPETFKKNHKPKPTGVKVHGRSKRA